jgi:adenylylsulfate kinase
MTARACSLFPHGYFIEIYCAASLGVRELRDVKELYARARTGEVMEFTGISWPYEQLAKPELVLDTGMRVLENCVFQEMELLQERGVVPGWGK